MSNYVRQNETILLFGLVNELIQDAILTELNGARLYLTMLLGV